MADFEILEDNLRATFRAYAQAKESGEAREMPGVLLACADVDFAMFNATLLTAPVANANELDRRVAMAAVHFRARALPWSFWICEGWLAAHLRKRADAVFWRRGLHLVTELPGMLTERVLPPARSLPHLECRRVGDDLTRSAFSYIMSICFWIPLSISRQIYLSERLWRSHFTGYLGYVDGNPVSTTATLVAGGTVGVYAVATLPAHQRNGYAEVMVRHALEQARQSSGLDRTILQSSPPAVSLYARMGYRTVTRYAVYASRT
jgi:GNAT superfamily N-acetyltransferase